MPKIKFFLGNPSINFSLCVTVNNTIFELSCCLSSLYNISTIDYPNGGDGWAPVGSPVFKIGGGLLCRPRWVRLPSIPAFSFNHYGEYYDHAA